MTISIESFTFLADLVKNNNKTWFDANRKLYDDYVSKPMKMLAEKLSGPVQSLLPTFTGKPKISRINNDIRFQKDKPPYKEHMWISFLSGTTACADIFVGIGTNGWSAGCGIGSQKREDMDVWRKNLLTYTDHWRRYSKATRLGDAVTVHQSEFYKKPLFDDIPEDIHTFVQTKGVWLFTKPRLDFDGIPEKHCFNALGTMLPYYLFMTVGTDELEERLSELGDKIPAPDNEVRKVWGKLA